MRLEEFYSSQHNEAYTLLVVTSAMIIYPIVTEKNRYTLEILIYGYILSPVQYFSPVTASIPSLLVPEIFNKPRNLQVEFVLYHVQYVHCSNGNRLQFSIHLSKVGALSGVD